MSNFSNIDENDHVRGRSSNPLNIKGLDRKERHTERKTYAVKYKPLFPHQNLHDIGYIVVNRP